MVKTVTRRNKNNNISKMRSEYSGSELKNMEMRVGCGPSH